MHKFQVTTIAVLLAMGGVMAAPAHAGVLDGFFNGLRDKANAAQSAIENIGAGKPKQNIDPAYKQVLLDGLKQLGVSEGVAQTSLVLLGGSLMSGDPTTGASDGITIKVNQPTSQTSPTP